MVACFGFSNPEWVIGPIKALRPRRLFLLEAPGEDQARNHLARAGFDIDSELGKIGPRAKIIKCDLWRPGQVAHHLRRLAEDEGTSQVPVGVNISCGPNTWCVGASLAASFSPLRLFHVVPYSEQIAYVPSFAQLPPPQGSMQVLRVLAGLGGEASGQKLKAGLREANFFPHRGGKTPSRIMEHLQLQTAVKPLQQIGAVQAQRVGSRLRYALGSAADALLEMFP